MSTLAPPAPSPTGSTRAKSSVWLASLKAHPDTLRRLDRTLVELHSMSVTGFLVLQQLQAAENGKLSHKTLGERLDLAAAAVAEVAHALAKARFIEPEPDHTKDQLASLTIASLGRVASAQAKRTLVDVGLWT